MFGRQKIAMMVAELLGTMILAITVYSMAARTSFPLFSGLAAGSTVAVFILTVGLVSGAHLNPAVTLGLWSLNKVRTSKAIVYIACQMLGGLAAWALIKYFMGHSLESLAGNKFEWKVFVAEAVGTAVFTFGVAAAVLEKLRAGKLAFTIGGSLLLGVMVASLASNAVVNPAVAVGIQSWNWAYATGPLLGAIIGMNLYGVVFNPEAIFVKSTNIRSLGTSLKPGPAASDRKKQISPAKRRSSTTQTARTRSKRR